MNFELMGFEELSRSIGAQYFSCSSNTGFSSVVIDSRNVKEGSLFVALTGASADGHNFIQAAFNAGAWGAMVEASKLAGFDIVNIAKKEGKELIIVDNSLKGLQDAARVYLEKFPNLLKIGITGSYGKTTVKEIAGSIIAQEKNTIINKGNLNSETGLPLSVFEIRSCHEAGVFEIGMNRRGEIAELARILKPNIALITNIGFSHIGNFGTKQAIAEEKKNIFYFLSDNGVAVIPGDDEYSDFLAEGIKGKICFYGKDSCAGMGEVRDMALEGSEIYFDGEKINFALPGKHNVRNAAAAIEIARAVPVSNNAIKRGLEKAAPLFGRGEILKGKITVIRDCYNSSPESAEQSISFCDSLDWPGKRLYVIGGMKELGGNSVSEHEKLGARLAASKADMVFLFGEETKAAAARIENACIENAHDAKYFYTCDFNELSSLVKRYAQTNDLVLLKGSRAYALERLGEMLAINNTEESNVS